MKHPDEKKTVNGARFIPTGKTRESGQHVYIEAQMLPIHPQRFEWINQRNVRTSLLSYRK